MYLSRALPRPWKYSEGIQNFVMGFRNIVGGETLGHFTNINVSTKLMN